MDQDTLDALKNREVLLMKEINELKNKAAKLYLEYCNLFHIDFIKLSEDDRTLNIIKRDMLFEKYKRAMDMFITREGELNNVRKFLA